MKNLIEKLFKENSIKGKIMKEINSQSLSDNLDVVEFASDRTGKIVYRRIYGMQLDQKTLSQAIQIMQQLGNGFSNPMVSMDAQNDMIEITETDYDMSEPSHYVEK